MIPVYYENAFMLTITITHKAFQDSGDKIWPLSPDDILHTPGRGLHLLLRLGDAADSVLDNPGEGKYLI